MANHVSAPPSQELPETESVAAAQPGSDPARRERTRSALLRIVTKHRDLLRDLAK